MHTAPSLSDLPVELGIRILEFLRGDSQALHSCCLISKLWSKHAQPILYKSIRINSGNVALFCATIRQRPELAGHIRKLTLDGLSGIPPPPLEFPSTRIEVLRVVGMELPNSSVLAALSASRSSIRMLILRDCYIAEPKQCLALPELMPKLKKFKIVQSWLRSRAEADAHLRQSFAPDLQSLSLTSSHSSVPVEVDSGSSDPSTHLLPCESLSVLKVLINGVGMSAFGEYLQDLGPGLRELNIGFDPDAMIEIGSRSFFPFNLNKCTDLRSFNINLIPLQPVEQFPAVYLSYVPVLLESLPVRCKRLQKVQFTIRAWRGATSADLDAFDWDRVGQILSKRRFASLRVVSTRMNGGSVDLREQFVPYFREKLHVLDQRKLLQFFVSVKVQGTDT
ncbi:hypothetical protein L227DRAFT_653783 [Lentinus tigrinus ALCF2SS1-6]|uniref:F-box domain-containing protein n=1 Tax=Lentinus tigrinus ALCF2SS1-6 TaxID=1328759 RepID=A0A5C2S9H0_9APHY|nr:hypothetical protein L227DRAFT_653783 [Lentinus tigrinus ALCF2SS1-6]